MLFADNAGPDQPAHLHRLIRVSIARLQNLFILQYKSTNREYPDQTARMGTHIWTFAVCIYMALGPLSRVTHHFMLIVPDCMDEQADLSFPWADMSEGTFSHVVAHLFYGEKKKNDPRTPVYISS